MGSPKGKGSGYRVVKMIEGRMKTIGSVEFAYLFLKDANLKRTGQHPMATGTRLENTNSVDEIFPASNDLKLHNSAGHHLIAKFQMQTACGHDIPVDRPTAPGAPVNGHFRRR